jgi:hypothetical protein
VRANTSHDVNFEFIGGSGIATDYTDSRQIKEWTGRTGFEQAVLGSQCIACVDTARIALELAFTRSGG